MKALFLAGGLGSRLKEMTKNLPKPMIPILEQPLLSLNIERLKKYDIDEIVLSTYYLPQKIKDYFGDGTRQGIKISYQKEEKPLGTGGAIKAAGKFFSETFFVFNADIVSDIDLKAMLRVHREKKADVTIAVTRVENPENYGVIEHDDAGYVTDFKEKPKKGETSSNLINAGIYILEPRILDEIMVGVSTSIEREIYPLLLRKNYKLAMYDKCKYWRDLGTPQDYLAFHQDILGGRVNFPAYNFSKASIYIGSDTRISDTVKLISPVYIGNGSTIAPYSVIGPYTVLGKNTIIGKKSKLKDCVVWASVNVGNCAKISNAVVMSDGIVTSKKNISQKDSFLMKFRNLLQNNRIF